MSEHGTKRRRRGPFTLAVYQVNQAAASASRAGMNVEEFVASALWAACLNDLPDTTVAGTTDLFNLSEAWGRIEHEMKREQSQ